MLEPPITAIIIISIGVWFILGLVLINFRYDYYKHSAEIALKRDMVERGMSAQEIKLVVEAGKSPNSDTALGADVPAQPARLNKPRLNAQSELA